MCNLSNGKWEQYCKLDKLGGKHILVIRFYLSYKIHFYQDKYDYSSSESFSGVFL